MVEKLSIKQVYFEKILRKVIIFLKNSNTIFSMVSTSLICYPSTRKKSFLFQQWTDIKIYSVSFNYILHLPWIGCFFHCTLFRIEGGINTYFNEIIIYFLNLPSLFYNRERNLNRNRRDLPLSSNHLYVFILSVWWLLCGIKLDNRL